MLYCVCVCVCVCWATICCKVVEVASDKEIQFVVHNNEAVVVFSRFIVDKVADDELRSLNSNYVGLYPKLVGESYFKNQKKKKGVEKVDVTLLLLFVIPSAGTQYLSVGLLPIFMQFPIEKSYACP